MNRSPSLRCPKSFAICNPNEKKLKSKASLCACPVPVPVRIAAAAAALDRTPSQERDDLLVALNGDDTRFFIADGVPAGYRVHGGPLPALLRSYGAALAGRDVRLLVPEERRRFRPQAQ